MADGQVVFEIKGDNSDIQRSLTDTTRSIERESRRWDNAVSEANKGIGQSSSSTASGIIDDFAGAFKAVTASAIAAKVAQTLKEWGAAAIDAASDLEEVQNVVDVTFGADANKIEQWARNAGTQFGLTETQAKRFTSTLGAMMKSAGLAGPEIVGMSTDLAGLAADMASFYNLDFETAFQKIQSGISGETEPLKALGINMSVANLEAYALSKGITTAFDKMSQGQQTLIRYQYLMQATADAQGDFSRTSDGYANSLRMLETNIESLKTSIGKSILPIVTDVVVGLNSMMSELTKPKPTTVLDEIAEIDLQTERKIAEIQQTADYASDLITTLNRIPTAGNRNIQELTEGLGNLKSGTVTNWKALLGALSNIGTITSKKINGRNFTDFAKAIAGEDESLDRGEAWNALLSELYANAEQLSELTGKDAEGTKAWLDSLSAAANQLDPNSARGWDILFEALTKGLSGGEKSGEFFTSQAAQFLAMGNESEEARQGLRELRYSEEEITTMQKEWLATTKELVNTIPGLADIINTETGEVQGGAEAIAEYVTAWQDGQRKIALWKAHNAKVDAFEQRRAAEYEKELAAITAKATRDRLRGELDALKAVANFTPEEEAAIGTTAALEFGDENLSKASKLARELEAAEKESTKATAEYEKEIEANAAAAQYLADEEAALNAEIGEQAGIVEDAAAATETLTDAQKAAATEGVTALTDALKELDTYYKQTRDETARTLAQTASGFGKVVTPAEQAREKMNDLQKQIGEFSSAGKDTSSLSKQFYELNESIPTADRMAQGLQSQLDFLNEYESTLQKARDLGLSSDVLAALADGSTESLDYLRALTDGTISANGDAVQRLNQQFAEVAQKREALATELTNQRLDADKEFDKLVEKAQETAEALDMSGEAKDAMTATVQGIADGIADKIPEVQTQVDALKKVLADLQQYGNFNAGIMTGNISPTLTINGEHATGLDYVPFDNYLAQLHEGESILTAEEARIWRDFKHGGAQTANSIDYGALHGAIWDGAPDMGGNVYLDGRTVGRVISGQQADSYRALERSGWRG